MNIRDDSIANLARLVAIAVAVAAAMTMAGQATAGEKNSPSHQVVQDWKRPTHKPTHKLKDTINRGALIKKKDVKAPSQLLCKNGRWVRKCEARGKGKPGDLFGPCLKWTRHWECNLPVVH